MIVCGEDGLTLGVLQKDLRSLLTKCGIKENEDVKRVFYRPSFGRRGGIKSSQFGEFDFIIVTSGHVLLGESKWSKNVSIEKVLKKPDILLKNKEQVVRHVVMTAYIKASSKVEFSDKEVEREKFSRLYREELGGKLKGKPMPTTRSKRLFPNLKWVISQMPEYTHCCDNFVINVLLYLHDGSEDLERQLQRTFKKNIGNKIVEFTLVPMRYESIPETASYSVLK